MKRYFYIIALRNNSNAVAPDSSYRLASGQVRAESLDSAYSVACDKHGVTLERDPSWTMRVVRESYMDGQRVSVYVTPMVDDMDLPLNV